MSEAWRQYRADFNAMNDEEIERETEFYRNQVDEAESWLEAVASWEAAGRPRDSGSDRNGEDAGTAAECEASQSGPKGIAQTPASRNPNP
jgi:hypothetical protein